MITILHVGASIYGARKEPPGLALAGQPGGGKSAVADSPAPIQCSDHLQVV